MTERLYYRDSFLYEFDGKVVEVVGPSPTEPRTGVVLDRTAFYPTSGGQVHDVGRLEMADGAGTFAIGEVADLDDGSVVHFIESPAQHLERGAHVHGVVDASRRRDHMQQHSGQHVLSAAFVRLFQMPTVSFHMGEDACSIDLDTPSVTPAQVVAAELMANDVILENRPVNVRYVTRAEAEKLGLRKVPPGDRDELRLVEVADFDLCACGGTHVTGTGQIGSILLRKTERVRQGYRVEFVCGLRAVATARRDYTALVDSASLYSSHIWDVPQQTRKMLDDAKRQAKAREDLLGELAEMTSVRLLSEAVDQGGSKVVMRCFGDRDAVFVKLLAQKITRAAPGVVALLGTTAGQAAVVFAASPGSDRDMGGALKKVLASVGGRGGGSKDFAQGGLPEGVDVQAVLAMAAKDLGLAA